MPLPVLLEPRHLFHCTRNSVSWFFFFPFSFSSGEEATEDNDSVLKESQTTTINHLGRSSKRQYSHSHLCHSQSSSPLCMPTL